jgi:hypothetical protein
LALDFNGSRSNKRAHVSILKISNLQMGFGDCAADGDIAWILILLSKREIPITAENGIQVKEAIENSESMVVVLLLLS